MKNQSKSYDLVNANKKLFTTKNQPLSPAKNNYNNNKKRKF